VEGAHSQPYIIEHTTIVNEHDRAINKLNRAFKLHRSFELHRSMNNSNGGLSKEAREELNALRKMPRKK